MAVRVTTICFSLLVSITILSNVIESYESGRRSNVTIATIHGHFYDCVDIYKQPTLLHPTLDSKRIKMIIVKELERQKKGKSGGFKAEEYWLNKEGCPIGTVPIRRMKKKQLQNARDASLSLSNEYSGNNWIDFAGIYIQASPPIERFFGVSAFLCLYNPQVRGTGQYSAASMSLETGAGQKFEHIQVGWIVHPKMNGDNRTHLYTKWTADGYHKTGCYNTHCPGFIQLSSVIPIDYVFPRISDIQTNSKEEVLLSVYQTQYLDYHLVMPMLEEEIGMWPYEIFDSLSAKGADTVRYGGQVYTPAGQDLSPAMGNGQFEEGHWQLTCYMRKVLYDIEVDGNRQQVPPDDSKVQTQESRCFYEGNQHNDNDGYWDYNFLFGGAGGGEHS
ncbi:protein neprosin [Nicotiana tabacum]|uniref:Protein neprosin n=1 Tax=Nicotiana tabacum TaxID=4097 RepID=A0A1S3Z7N4_TOBAC|nr:PREDICTED: uncharacterized protein LOC107783714 [Nicotiana tabacum]